MTAAEQGFLLLTGSLGDPQRKPLTVTQFRELTKRMRLAEKPEQERELQESDLLKIGCDSAFAQRVLNLLSQTEQMKWYLEKGRKQDCCPLTRNSQDYPHRLRNALGMEAPGILWIKGDWSLLQMPCVSLVGSRDLNKENLRFSQEVGRQAALQGYVLISGNARGADKIAQESCLEHGGKVIIIVADALEKHPLRRNVLYIAQEGYELPFSVARALQRNRVIHALGQMTFVAQCTYEKGGTWDGTVKNLRYSYSPVLCFDDASKASQALSGMGATLIKEKDLTDFEAFEQQDIGLINI